MQKQASKRANTAMEKGAFFWFHKHKKKIAFTFQRVAKTFSIHPEAKPSHLAHQRQAPRITLQITKRSGFQLYPMGRQVQIDFETFDPEDSESCKNDYVEFREAYIDGITLVGGFYGPILTKRLYGKTKPSTIQSKESIVWVQLKSDSNSITVYKGFKASFKGGLH